MAAQKRFRLTGPFEPLLLRESVGAFANPVDQTDLKVGFKLGAGVQQINVRDGYALADNSDTPEIEVNQLVAIKDVTADLAGFAPWRSRPGAG